MKAQLQTLISLWIVDLHIHKRACLCGSYSNSILFFFFKGTNKNIHNISVGSCRFDSSTISEVSSQTMHLILVIFLFGGFDFLFIWFSHVSSSDFILLLFIEKVIFLVLFFLWITCLIGHPKKQHKTILLLQNLQSNKKVIKLSHRVPPRTLYLQLKTMMIQKWCKGRVPRQGWWKAWFQKWCKSLHPRHQAWYHPPLLVWSKESWALGH